MCVSDVTIPEFVDRPVPQVASFLLDNRSYTNMGQLCLVSSLLVPLAQVELLLEGTD